jgi:hypothetical protein
MTDLLELALDDLIPSFADEQPDWAGVIVRSTQSASGPPRLRARHTRRTLALAFLLLLLVGSAVAFAGRVHDLFFGKPAPPIIKRAFMQQNQMRSQMRQWEKAHGHPLNSLPRVNAGRAHGVMAAKTQDGLLLLWAAPATGGGECWFVEFAADQLDHNRPTGSGSCSRAPAAPSTVRWASEWSAAHRTLTVLSGRLDTDADAVRVRLRHGAVRTIPVVDRYFLGAFAHTLGAPVRLTALDAKGHVVARSSVR